MNVVNFRLSKTFKNSPSWKTSTYKVWIPKTILIAKSWKNLPSRGCDEKWSMPGDEGEINLSLLGVMMVIMKY